MIRRFIADEHEGDRAALLGQNTHHLATVLRVRVGQQFDIAVGDSVRRGTVTNASSERVEFSLAETVSSAEQHDVVALLAIFKFDRFEWAIEKATELGVTTIVPVIARRTDAHLAQAAAKRVERWRRIAHEAAQQSRRTAVPEIEEPVKLPAKLKDLATSSVKAKLLLSETEDGRTLAQAIRTSAGEGPVILAIGPEGGWAPEELKLFADKGWDSTSLGKTILRAETATVAALAIVQSELVGDS